MNLARKVNNYLFKKQIKLDYNNVLVRSTTSILDQNTGSYSEKPDQNKVCSFIKSFILHHKYMFTDVFI